MLSMLQVTALVLITIFGAAAALAFNWLLLRTMFALMRPATAGRVPATLGGLAARTHLAQGTTQLARVYLTNR